MRWDRFFEDLEDQLDSEWEAERAVLDTEAERLRLARVTLRERLAALGDGRGTAVVSAEVADGSVFTGRVSACRAHQSAPSRSCFRSRRSRASPSRRRNCCGAPGRRHPHHGCQIG
jgi:hypothetical protein